MRQDQLGVVGVMTIGVVLQRPIEIGTQLGAPIGRQYVLQKEIAIPVKALNPGLNLFIAGFLTGKVGG